MLINTVLMTTLILFICENINGTFTACAGYAYIAIKILDFVQRAATATM